MFSLRAKLLCTESRVPGELRTSQVRERDRNRVARTQCIWTLQYNVVNLLRKRRRACGRSQVSVWADHPTPRFKAGRAQIGGAAGQGHVHNPSTERTVHVAPGRVCQFFESRPLSRLERYPADHSCMHTWVCPMGVASFRRLPWHGPSPAFLNKTRTQSDEPDRVARLYRGWKFFLLKNYHL